MSMISSQVDELRALAGDGSMEWVSGPIRASILRDAADTIWELRNKLAGTVDMRERARLAEMENAKLRELVQDMYACISHANEQDWFYFERDKRGCGMSCTVNGEKCGLSAFADRMRELGVDE